MFVSVNYVEKCNREMRFRIKKIFLGELEKKETQ